MLSIRELSCGYGLKTVVDRISLTLAPGEILCLLGPNGVGKTTLFKTILHLQPSLGGQILVDGEDIKSWPSQRRAQTIAYVPQAHTPPFPFTVTDVVTMGCTARLGMFSAPSAKDRQSAADTLEMLGIGHLSARIYTEISGGERQMVLIARALVQRPRILVLDEPTSNLDFGNQIKVLKKINQLAAQGMAIIMTTHFPNHVFLCSTSVALMGRDGRILAGSLDEVVTESRLESAYGVKVKLVDILLDDGQTVRTCVPLMATESRVPEPALI